MGQNHGDRPMPDLMVASILRAAAQEMGIYSLNMLLRNAGLLNPGTNKPPEHPLLDQLSWGEHQVMTATGFAGLQRVIRDYYGTGARGLLNRIGRGAWYAMLKEIPISKKAGLMAIRILPLEARRIRCLEFLAGQLNQASVHELEGDFILVDQASDGAYGQSCREPICWLTAGLIQAAMVWALSEEPEVEEIACRATGADACKFRISL